MDADLGADVPGSENVGAEIHIAGPLRLVWAPFSGQIDRQRGDLGSDVPGCGNVGAKGNIVWVTPLVAGGLSGQIDEPGR